MAFGDVYGTSTFGTAPVSSGWYNWLDGGPLAGSYARFILTSVGGNVNALFVVEGLLPDGVTVVRLGSDPLGPINVPGERTVRFSNGFNGGALQNPVQFRFSVYPNELPQGFGSKNSSSLSSQTFPSSSSGGTNWGAWTFGLVPAWNG